MKFGKFQILDVHKQIKMTFCLDFELHAGYSKWCSGAVYRKKIINKTMAVRYWVHSPPPVFLGSKHNNNAIMAGSSSPSLMSWLTPSNIMSSWHQQPILKNQPGNRELYPPSFTMKLDFVIKHFIQYLSYYYSINNPINI